MREIIFYSEVRIKLEMFVGDDKKKKIFFIDIGPFPWWCIVAQVFVKGKT